MSKKQALSIYLLKNEETPESVLQGGVKLIDYEKIEGAKYTEKKIPTHPPDWAKYLGLEEEIKVSSASAVLFIPQDKRWFALCFGYGHTLLDQNRLEDDFGLKTTLNMLDPDKIKSSDVFAPSEHSKQRRVQTSQDSSLLGHDVDKASHILKGITGKTKAKYAGLSKNISAIYGRIKINTTELVGELKNLCHEIFKIYQKDDCKENFPEAFYIRPIKSQDQMKILDDKLCEELNKFSDGIYFDIPELVDFQEINNFRIRLGDRKRHIYEDTEIGNFYKLLKEKGITVSLTDLKKWKINLLNSNGMEKKSYSLYKCLLFDYSGQVHDQVQKNYHFSHGKWYCLDNDFSCRLKSVDKYKKEKIGDKNITEYGHNNEAAYNQDLAKDLGGYCLDKKLITMGGYDKIEPCDVLYISGKDTNTFVHVKVKHGGSAGLSHLFEQGDVSLTLLNTKNATFVDGIKKRVENFNEDNHKIIHFLIVGNTERPLPLFTRVSLFKKMDQIRAKGAKAYWSVIDKNEHPRTSSLTAPKSKG